MKQVVKYVAIIFALMLSASIIFGCLTAGVKLIEVIVEESGGSFNIDEDTPLWYTTEDGDLMVFGIRIGSNDDVKSGTEIFEEKLECIDIESPSGKLIIETWEKDYVQVEYKNIPEDYDIYLKDGTLVIEEKDFAIRWGWGFHGNAELTISVPEGITLTEVAVESGSGSKIISNVTTDTFYLDSGSGSVNVSNVTAKKTVLSSGSGSVTVKDSVLGATTLDTGSGFCTFDNVEAHNMVVDSGSGQINYIGVLTGNCDFDTGSGAIKLELEGNEEDYNIRADLGSGGLYINGNKEKDTDIKYRDASNLLVFDTGSGKVSIWFNEK